MDRLARYNEADEEQNAALLEALQPWRDQIDPTAAMCQCGHTRSSHGTPSLLCWGCGSDLPCDAPGVTVKRRDFARTWTWNLRCEQHGTLQINGPIDDWEPDAVTDFRREHAGHVHPIRAKHQN